VGDQVKMKHEYKIITVNVKMSLGVLCRIRSRKRKTKEVYENYENYALLGYYAASSGNFLPTFRNNYRSHLNP